MGQGKRAIGRFELGERLGSGGMAEVFRASTPGLGRARQDVALKRMHPHLASDPEFVALFFREAQVASTLRHPNLVGVLESGEADGEYFLVMELVEGITLRQLISTVARQHEAFDLAAAVSIVRDMCVGLHHAHERTGPDGASLGIVHRDISPGNVFVSFDGSVKVGDFGVATAAAEWTELRSTTGSIRGKLSYMAPEQARGHAVDRRADVFAVGNVLFELVQGHRLLRSGGEVEMLHELVFGGYGDPAPTRPDCPASLTEIIRRALQTDPSQRFSTALDMARALERCAEAEGLSTHQTYIRDYVADRVAAPEPTMDFPAAPNPSRTYNGTVATVPATPRQSRGAIGVALGLGGGLVLALVGTGAWWLREPAPTLQRSWSGLRERAALSSWDNVDPAPAPKTPDVAPPPVAAAGPEVVAVEMRSDGPSTEGTAGALASTPGGEEAPAMDDKKSRKAKKRRRSAKRRRAAKRKSDPRPTPPPAGEALFPK